MKFPRGILSFLALSATLAAATPAVAPEMDYGIVLRRSELQVRVWIEEAQLYRNLQQGEIAWAAYHVGRRDVLQEFIATIDRAFPPGGEPRAP